MCAFVLACKRVGEHFDYKNPPFHIKCGPFTLATLLLFDHLKLATTSLCVVVVVFFRWSNGLVFYARA